MFTERPDDHLEADYEDRQTGAYDEPDFDEDIPDEDEDYEPDPEVEFRRSVLMEVMARHPDMAFTGSSVNAYIYGDGDPESASIDDPMAGEY